MKKITIMIILLITFILMQGQFIWEDPGIWAGQESMIQVDDYNSRLITMESDGGYIFVWMENKTGDTQVYGQKLSASGDELWEEPISFISGEFYPSLQYGISDSSGNVIITYFFPGENMIHFMKRDSDGALIWETEFGFLPGGVINPFLRRGIEDDFYLCYQQDAEEYGRNNGFCHFDEDGNITWNWVEGMTLGYRNDDFCKVDDAGNLAVLFLDDDDALVLQKYTADGESVYPGGITIVEDFYGGSHGSGIFFEITPGGDYLCGWNFATAYILQNGNLAWVMNNYNLYDFQTEFLVAGNDVFYAFSSDGEVYQFDYQTQLQWFQTVMDESEETASAWIKTDDGIRFIKRNTVYYDEIQNYTLIDYNSDGELISPASGWYDFDVYPQCYRSAWFRTTAGETFWAGLKRDDQLQQVLDFVVISDSGDFLTGTEPVIVREGVERYLIPQEVYIAEDFEAILMKHTGYQEMDYGGNRLILQCLNGAGEPLSNPEGDIVFSGVTRVLDRNDNLVLIYNREMEQKRVHLLDMELGVDLWGESGIDFALGESVGYVSGSLTGDVANIYWDGGDDFKYQQIIGGETVLEDGGVIVELNQLAYGEVDVRGRFLINHYFWGGLHISHIGDEGDIDWSTGCGRYILTIQVNDDYRLTEQGLLVLHSGTSIADVRCQLLSNEGEHVFGTNGLDIGYEIPENIWGIVLFSNSFGVIRYDAESGNPAKFQSYTMAGAVLQEEVYLPDTENCEIVDVQAVDDGLVVFMTQLQGEYADLKMGYYDFNGNLQNIPGENPVTCYAEYSHNKSLAAEVFDDDVYFCWQSMVSNPYQYMGYSGSDVMIQGWSIPEVKAEENDIPSVTCTMELMPNPFNPELHISWTLAKDGVNGTISIYNVKGQIVWKEDIIESKGDVVWEGRDISGSKCSSGVYFIRLQSGNEVLHKRAVLLK
ncbi:MAG: T9SS type A sorting domain-containing protein [Candidatus Cloacimonetes bacterium]|nr:T9SS type A sorting domain-containing protein [Candidatus Cloacimonadota bacterium]